jgi:hypothetical protein
MVEGRISDFGADLTRKSAVREAKVAANSISRNESAGNAKLVTG